MVSKIVNNLLEPWQLIYKNLPTIKSLYVGDLRARFAAGNILGWAWVILYPLLFLSAYATLFIGLLSIRLPSLTQEEYILMIFVGLVAWFAISEGLAGGIGLVQTHANTLKHTFYPLELVGVRMMLVHITQFIVSMGLILLALIIISGPKLAWIQLPLLTFSVATTIVGLYWFLGTLGAFFKDLVSVINIIIMLMFLITPIGYTEDMVSGKMQAVITFNPVTYIIRGFRQALMFGEWLSLDLMIGLMVGPILLMYVGYFMFSRLKPVFSELV